MRRFALLLAVLAVFVAPLAADRVGAARGQAAATFPLTVDSIMRGPDLVGSAPSGVRWSGDSTKVYFEWQRPGEDEASTWVVGRRAASRVG